MHRRRFLAVAASAGAVGALAGCTQDEGANDSPDPAGATGSTETEGDSTATGTTTDEGTTRSEATAEGGPTTRPGTVPSGNGETRTGTTGGVDYSVSVAGSQCGTGASDSRLDDIAFGEDEATVAVTGTIDGATPCKAVDVTEIDYDSDGGSVRVVVATVDPEDGREMCGQCLGAIGYEATLTFADAFPSEATIVHDGQNGRRSVGSAAYGSASATAPTPTTTGSE